MCVYITVISVCVSVVLVPLSNIWVENWEGVRKENKYYCAVTCGCHGCYKIICLNSIVFIERNCQ